MLMQRRGLLGSLLAAPFVVRTPGLLMPVKRHAVVTGGEPSFTPAEIWSGPYFSKVWSGSDFPQMPPCYAGIFVPGTVYVRTGEAPGHRLFISDGREWTGFAGMF